MIWKRPTPTYGPNGGVYVLPCTPRTCAPASAVSVPDDCTTPLTDTTAVTAMLSENALKSGGGGGRDDSGGS